MPAHIHELTDIYRHINKKFEESKPPTLRREMKGSYKCFPHVDTKLTLPYNRKNIVLIKNAIILNILNNIVILRGTKVVICMFDLRVRVPVVFVCLMVLNSTLNNISIISWRSVLLVEETTWPRRKSPTCHKSPTNFIK